MDWRGEIIGVCFNHSHAWTWDIPFNLMESYYQAYCEWFRYLKKPDYQYKFRLTPGDCIIAQNNRIFHGREAFAHNSGVRHLKTAFSEWDYLVGRKNYMAFKHFFLEENLLKSSNQDNFT
ncbi:MAG: TauD/TfdA family dioxygenase [Waterburya sp.]